MLKYKETAKVYSNIGEMSDEEIAEATIDFEIAHVIRDAREAKNLSKRELAKIMGITPSAISKWETGKQNFSIRTLIKIASALGCEVVCPIRVPDTSRYKKES